MWLFFEHNIIAVNKSEFVTSGFHMRMIWKQIKDIFHDANGIAFSSAAFHIVGKETDSLTKRAIFQLKARRIGSVVSLSTSAIINDDHYLTGLSSGDRAEIFTQYQVELKQPIAIIDSISIFPEKNNKYLIKIFLISENKMICATASEFLENKALLDMLSHQDVSQISKIYAFEKFPDDDGHAFISDRSNVRYL